MSGHNDDDSSGDEQETWFAGGERSGISVQNPGRGRVPGGNLVRDLLRRAEEEGAAVPEGAQPQSTVFSGGGHMLGGEGVESSFIPGQSSQGAEETVTRRLTFWREGFTVEDGALMRYDDPANADVLAAIHAGHAPPSILNVRPGQRVDVQVTKRTDDDYVPPKPRPFQGSGNRLGAPVPAARPATQAAASSSTAERANITTRFEVDQSLPTTSVQVRLADGTRMVCRMNLTHTVLDLRNFISASRPENITRSYTIGTTFPNRTLEDDTATIESAGLANSVVVQRWA
ncbi:SEP-domain-containing protein [Mycena belliarum]|uniref:SEP-domain-containing protein n=1 Tax=Mycena belliarum TaxID=1033014 RepID=A0AAD6XND0_9AGAR|nr:SEP-domain-containing protein [Mycena belliae]